MLKLGQFVQTVNEGRPRKDAEEAVPMDDVDISKVQKKIVSGGKPAPASSLNAAKPGKSAKENGSHGVWAEEPPSISQMDPSNNRYEKMDLKDMTKNQRKLSNRIRSGADFMVIGEAGWGKTAIITDVAHEYGYTIITVYLDKAVASDLGGIPVPTTDEQTGEGYMNYLMPGWALTMLRNPDTKYLLFFDEMNQAADDVQNALMPIVEKKVICGVQFDNYIVGAAGNHAFENGSVGELSIPLRQRLMPFTWECRTPGEWASHFEWAHKHYDDKIGAEVINKTAELKDYWNSPRDITKKIYKWCEQNKNGNVRILAEDLYEEIVDGAVWDQVDKETRKFKADMNAFCEYLLNWANNGGKSAEEHTRSRSKGADNIDKNDKEVMMDALEAGYYYNKKSSNPNGDDKKYLVTKENCVTAIFDPSVTGITAEVFPRVLKEMEASGRRIKYNTNADGEADAKKNGWIVLSE